MVAKVVWGTLALTATEITIPMTIDEFFAGYVDVFNRSLGDAVDTEGIRRHFSSCFVGAGPQGVHCGQNDEHFTEMLKQGYAFYRSIETRAMAVREVTTIPIDATHALARVAYTAHYVKPRGEPVAIDFEVSYVLAARGESYEIFAFVTGDEMALYQKHGLVPDADAS
jgi:hypothetical protein